MPIIVSIRHATNFRVNMWHFSLVSCSMLLFLSLLIPHHKSSPTQTLPVDLVDQTCKSCTNETRILSYNFCLTSLQAVPVSHAVNLQGLAVIAMELAVQNATNTASVINKLLDGRADDPYATICLEDCLELYLDAVTTMVNSILAFLSEQYEIANVWVSAVMEAATTCEQGFAEKAGEVSPLTEENYNLFQLCDIALCIIHLLTMASPSVSS